MKYLQTTKVISILFGFVLSLSTVMFSQAAITGNNQTRSSAFNDYKFYKDNVKTIAPGWTGSISGCNPGTVSAAYTQATLDSINYSRALAKLPPVVFNAALAADAQDSALMSLANSKLDHFPTPDWECYTPGGDYASGRSNLCLGCAGTRAIEAYMSDYGSFDTLGHRRWILDGSAVEMGLGDTGSSNTLHVITAANSSVQAGSPELALWPSQGYWPDGLYAPMWSASEADGTIDLVDATVSVTINGQPVSIEMRTLFQGYADYTIAWLLPAQNFIGDYNDIVVKTTLSNLKDSGGSPIADYSYTTIIFDDDNPIVESADVPHWFGAGNIDGDIGPATDDLVHRHKNGIVTWKSDADGTYTQTSNGAPWFGYTFYSGEWLTPGDITGEGEADLIHRYGGGVNSWKSDGDGTYSITGFSRPNSGYSMTSGEWLTPGNVDGDGGGTDDLVHRHANGINVWKSDGDGTYTISGNGAPWAGYSFKAGVWETPGDLNGDGAEDLVHRHGGGMNVWFSDGDGTFTVVSMVKPAGYSMTSGEWIMPGDIDTDADGYNELIHRHANGVNVWRVFANGTYTINSADKPWTGYSFTAGQWLAPGDLDGDGAADLIHLHGGGMNAWLSNGLASDGKFSIVKNTKPSPGYSMYSGEWIAPGNIDGDASGTGDLIHRHTNGINTWKSDGDGTFTITGNGPPWPGYSFE